MNHYYDAQHRSLLSRFIETAVLLYLLSGLLVGAI